jgi:hypothetical protein
MANQNKVFSAGLKREIFNRFPQEKIATSLIEWVNEGKLPFYVEATHLTAQTL